MNGASVNAVSSILGRRREGVPVGMVSACTASELAIEARLERSRGSGGHVLVEATANQVDQRGGYTGMRPADFARFVLDLADRRGFPRERVILGGDHLGPLTWRELPASQAMDEAAVLIRLFVLAGFTKLHLDTSMHLGDDDRAARLHPELVAVRAAALARAAEDAHPTLRAQDPRARRRRRPTGRSRRVKRRFSYSDRWRYYLPAPPVRGALERLFANLGAVRLPISVVSQFLPRQYARIREGLLAADPRALVRDRVGDCVDDYLRATGAPPPATGDEPWHDP